MPRTLSLRHASRRSDPQFQFLLVVASMLAVAVALTLAFPRHDDVISSNYDTVAALIGP